MAGYRDTLNLPKTDFPMKANLTQREPERIAWWDAQDLYGKLRAARRGAPVWLLHDGPPYSNNHLHMGTAANKIWKDAAVRQASLMGFDSPYVPGWDNHGMPIEVQVSREFREKKLAPDRLALRRRCREFASHWVGIQREEFKRLGVWGEWENPYLTMDHGFEAAILDTFAALAARGFVQRGQRSIHWCPTDRTALAEAEIEYADVPSPSIFVAFPLRRDPTGVLDTWPGVAAVAWTTTPWTLPANLGLMVAPDADYVVVEADGRTLLLAEPRLEAVAAAAGWNGHRVLGRVEGRALVDTVFEGPFGGDSRTVDGTPFVTMEDGTGIVHTAPGHGKEDFQVGQRTNLGVLCPVDEAGRFFGEVTAPFTGRSVLEVDDDIVKWLEGRGRLVASSRFSHSYPHCWRCHNPVIFRATDQWFMIIDHAGHRGRALEQIEHAVKWDPPASQNRIRESVRLRPDWCLSRQRSWGVGIPALYCGSCERALLVPGVMANAAALVREHGSDAWYELPVERFLPAGFTCPECGKAGPFEKESDILDVWFDSGSTHRAVQATHPALREAWTSALQSGRVVYFEGPDQHRGWFNSSLMVGVGAADRAPYTHVMTHGWVLDQKGRAMHKSLGNVIWPEDVVKRYGAEIVRWWALATDWRGDVRVGDETLERVADAYRKVRNTFRFVLGNLSDFGAGDALPGERLTAVDRAFAGLLAGRVERIRREYETLQFHRALDVLLDVCTVDLSAVFLDAAKDRLYASAPDDPARRSAQTVLWRALHDLCIAASPALAFTAEEVWQHHPSLLAESPSVHLALYPRREVPANAAADWEFLTGIRDAVNAAIEPLRAAKTLNTTAEAEVVLTVAPDAVARLDAWRDELAGFLIVAAIEIRAGREGQEPEAVVTRTAHTRCDRCWIYRPDVAAEGGRRGLCGRCMGVLEATRG